MKNKPIDKGFKFWACCCPTTGFVFCFVPSGQLSKENIYKIVNEMADLLPGMQTCKGDEDTNYVFVIDNFFTTPKTIGEEGLWGKGVGSGMLEWHGNGRDGHQSQLMMLMTKGSTPFIITTTQTAFASFGGSTTMWC